MLVGWLKQRRAYRAQVEAEASRLQTIYGRAAYVEAMKAARSPLTDYQFAEDVRQAVGKRLGQRMASSDAPPFLVGHT